MRGSEAMHGFRARLSNAAPLAGNAAAGLLTALPFLDGRLFFCAYPGLILFLALRFAAGGRRF